MQHVHGGNVVGERRECSKNERGRDVVCVAQQRDDDCQAVHTMRIILTLTLSTITQTAVCVSAAVAVEPFPSCGQPKCRDHCPQYTHREIDLQRRHIRPCHDALGKHVAQLQQKARQAHGSKGRAAVLQFSPVCRSDKHPHHNQHQHASLLQRDAPAKGQRQHSGKHGLHHL